MWWHFGWVKLNQEISGYFDNLQHLHKDLIVDVYSQLVLSNPELETNIKWNAPNFVKNEIDCVTFRLFPNDCFQIILHRGAKVKVADDFRFDAPLKLARWAAQDRGILDLLKSPEDNLQKIELINLWIAAI